MFDVIVVLFVCFWPWIYAAWPGVQRFHYWSWVVGPTAEWGPTHLVDCVEMLAATETKIQPQLYYEGIHPRKLAAGNLKTLPTLKKEKQKKKKQKLHVFLFQPLIFQGCVFRSFQSFNSLPQFSRTTFFERQGGSITLESPSGSFTQATWLVMIGRGPGDRPRVRIRINQWLGTRL